MIDHFDDDDDHDDDNEWRCCSGSLERDNTMGWDRIGWEGARWHVFGSGIVKQDIQGFLI